jgi:hypothetical protein
MASITPAEAQAYCKRWDLVKEIELAELGRTSMDTKLRQLSAFLGICRTNFVRLIRDARLSGFPDEVARDPFCVFDLMSQRCGQFDTE